MFKLWRDGQNRNGKASRRRLEFNAVMYNVRRRKQAFIDRLQARLMPRGECLCYNGSLDHKGYARLTLSYKPEGADLARVVAIHAHRLYGAAITRIHKRHPYL